MRSPDHRGLLVAELEGAEPVTLDEVRREPALLSAGKRAIDRKRKPELSRHIRGRVLQEAVEL